MLSNKKLKASTFALAALMTVGGLAAAPNAAHAQTRYQASLDGQHMAGGAVRPANEVTPMDTTGTPASGDPDYTDTFAGVTSEAQGAISGPGKLAIGVMVLGCVFGVVWRLTGRGIRKIG